MSLNTIERQAVGWFLAINNAERKQITAHEVRCLHRGCLLAAVVTVHKELYVLGVWDATETGSNLADIAKQHLPKLDVVRLTPEALSDMTLDEFIASFRHRPRAFSLLDVAEASPGTRNGWLNKYKYAPAGIRARCRHLEGFVPGFALSIEGPEVVRLARLG